MSNGPGSLRNGEIGASSTKNQQKRDYQGLMDTSEQDLFFIKKQAIEYINSGAISGAELMNYSFFRDTCSPQLEGHIGDHHIFDRQVQALNSPNKNDFTAISVDTNMQNKDFKDRYDIDSCAPVSISQRVDDSQYLHSEVRKVKVNEVSISDDCLTEYVGNSSYPGEKDTVPRNDNNILLETTYNNADVNTVSVDPAFSNVHKNIISIGQSSSKGDAHLLLNNMQFNGMDVNMLSDCEAFNRTTFNTVPLGEHYERNCGSILLAGSSRNGLENFFAVNPLYNKSNGTFNMPVDSSCNKQSTNISSLISVHDQQDADAVFLRTGYRNENSVMLSLGENYEQGDQTTISFGGIQDDLEDADASCRLLCSHDNFLNQISAQSSQALGQIDYMEKVNANCIMTDTLRRDDPRKNTEHKAKKGSSNNFPANVKSLLSTGILDGIPVKYVSWSREKNLRGIIRGTGYLCSCQDCNLSKAINAYEFERHAGCKTKHPNNHIFFENGKTIYAVVQELRSTPQEMLFEVIQNVAGSPVNQTNFHTWKASYQAATRELQRIYGKD